MSFLTCPVASTITVAVIFVPSMHTRVEPLSLCVQVRALPKWNSTPLSTHCCSSLSFNLRRSTRAYRLWSHLHSITQSENPHYEGELRRLMNLRSPQFKSIRVVNAYAGLHIRVECQTLCNYPLRTVQVLPCISPHIATDYKDYRSKYIYIQT